MANGKFLGKINKVTFGHDGDGRFGPYFDLTFDGSSGVSDVRYMIWAKRPERAQYSVEQHRDGMADMVEFIRDSLTAANKRYIHELPGTPIEVTIEGNMLKSWRVLTEVL